jgi:transcriptional regulator with XRE-family HTH domain
MSIIKVSTINDAVFKQFVIRNAVQSNRQALADYVRAQMKKGERDWSNHEVARRAKAAGFNLSNGTVWGILNCRYKDVKDTTLEALAHVFGVPKAEIVSVYLGPPTEAENLIRNERLAALAADAEKLSPEDLPKFEALMDYVQATVRQMIKDHPDAIPRGKGKAAKSRVGSATPHGR